MNLVAILVISGRSLYRISAFRLQILYRKLTLWFEADEKICLRISAILLIRPE